jgi:flagellar capping protein FliD
MFTNTSDIKENGKVKEFRAFVVWNYTDEKVQIMEITQNSIKNQIYKLANDEDFGDPKTYDLKINRS